MAASIEEQKDRIWQSIEAEKGRDRTIQRINRVAWTVTFIVLILVGLVIGLDTWRALRDVLEGYAPFMVVFHTAMPFLWILGTVSLLIAVLSTVGVFMRFRTASLAEIQLRLAAMEEMLSSQANGEGREVL